MFFVFMAIEYGATLLFRIKDPKFRIKDLAMSTASGMFQQVFDVIIDLIGLEWIFHIYNFVYTHHRLTTIDPVEYPILTYVVLLLGKDLAYYWVHRTLHEFHVGWASHIAHHSGEDMNLATGLRQGALQGFFSLPVYGIAHIGLAICGFSPVAFAAHAQLNTLYQFWVHTELFGRLPFGLEYIFNSPSSHRMHHRPPGNQNYAGFLIVWDRLFGTFRAETQRQDWYGLARPAQSFRPLELNFMHWRVIWRMRGGFFSRRVPWTWVCDPSLLFAPLPPLLLSPDSTTTTLSVSAPSPAKQRNECRKDFVKYDGVAVASAGAHTAFAVLSGLGLGVGLGVLTCAQRLADISTPAVAAAAGGTALLAELMGYMWDNQEGRGSFAAAGVASLSAGLIGLIASYI